MVHVIEALTPPEGNFASPSAIVVNGLPIQNVYYNGTLVRGQSGTAWPDKVVTKEDTWSITSVSDGGRIRYAAQGSSGYRVIGLAYSVEVTKTKNELGLSGTVSCNTDGVSGYSYAMQDGSTGNNLKQQGELSQSDSVTNPSITISAITSGTTLPDYDGADKISSKIVVSGNVRLAYEGTLLSGQAEIVDPTYTASWTRRVRIRIPQANPYIQITAQEVSWKRDNTNVLNHSTMRAKWSVKIKWTSNDFCDLTGTVVNFVISGRVVVDNNGTIVKTFSSGTTTSTYTLAAGTGEETITLSCSWSDKAQGYLAAVGTPIPYAVRSKINATVSNIPANATSSGSLAIAEKSSSIHVMLLDVSPRSENWPSGWFDTTSLSDVSTIQFLQKATTADNVFIRAPKTITVDARIRITNPRITRSGTTLKFAWDSLIIPSITWGVKSNLSFSQDMNLFVVMRIRNKRVRSSLYMPPIHVDGTSSGSLSNLIISSGSISCEEYASGEEGDPYTTISCYLYLNYVGRPTLPNVPLISAFETADELSADAALGLSGPVRYSSLRIDTGGGGASYVPQPLPDLSSSNASRPLWDGGLVIEGQPYPENTEPALLSMIFDKSSLAAPSLAFLGDVNYFASWRHSSYSPTTQELTLSQDTTAIVNMLSRHGAYAYLPIVNTYDIMGVPSFTDFYIEVEFTTFIYGSWQTEPLGHLSCSGQFPLSTSVLPFNFEPATGTTITGGSPCILSLVDAPDDSTVRLYVQVHYTFPDISAFPNKHIAYADTIDVWSTAVALPTQQERATNPRSVLTAFNAAATLVRHILQGTDPDNPHRGQYRVEYRSN